MRTVSGASDRVVVVGAGLGGLSTALHLAGAGREVTVLERLPYPGGRAGVIADSGYLFDNGPTVLTMPNLLEATFDAVGERLDDWVTLRRLDPAYRAWFHDGSSLDVRADPEATATEIEGLCGPADAEGFRRYVRYVTRLYQLEMRAFIARNVDSPLDMLTPDLARLTALGGFGRMARTVGRHVQDPRVRRILSFQSLYAGLSPFQALSLYCVISYMDTVAGVYAVDGGMHAVPEAMARAAEKHGVNVRCNVEVVRIEHDGRRATGVITGDGERLACDVVVVNADLPVAYRMLLGQDPWTVRRLSYSPSCYLMLVGSSASYSKVVHHNIHFGKEWSGVFDDLTRRGELMTDPSFLVSNPTRSDSELAPPGRHIYYVLFPTPNATAGINWQTEGGEYRREILETLESRGYVGFEDAIEIEHTIDPDDWSRAGMTEGTPFAAAHSFWQTGPFRPRNIWGENVVFAGSGTTPGVGVPMVLVSGQLAAERVTGGGGR
jgi:phytoene desaturase